MPHSLCLFLRLVARLSPSSSSWQCVREWSDEGALERKQSFTPILQELEMRLPIDRTTRNKYVRGTRPLAGESCGRVVDST